MESKSTMQDSDLKQVSASAIYRLLFIGLGITMLIFSAFCGVMSIFGADMVKWNGVPVHGPMALPLALLLGAFISLILTAIVGSIACLGLWIYSRFRPLQVRTLN